MNAKNNNKNGMNVIENVENEVQVAEESRKGIDELVKMVLKECNISPDDTSSWAKDIRTMIKYAIEHFDEEMEEDEVDPDEENRIISGQWIGDGIELRGEAHGTAGLCVPHTFEEEKAYCIAEEDWEAFLVSIGMTEAEYKAYKGGIE